MHHAFDAQDKGLSAIKNEMNSKPAANRKGPYACKFRSAKSQAAPHTGLPRQFADCLIKGVEESFCNCGARMTQIPFVLMREVSFGAAGDTDGQSHQERRAALRTRFRVAFP